MVGEWKQLVNFCEKGSFLVILAAYLLRGLFYRRTNLAISIRYISEKHLQESKNITSCQDGTKRNRGYGSNWPIPKQKSSILFVCQRFAVISYVGDAPIEQACLILAEHPVFVHELWSGDEGFLGVFKVSRIISVRHIRSISRLFPRAK